MWGFIVFLISGVDIAGWELFQIRVPFNDHPAYLLIRDTFILLVIIGSAGFILRRRFTKPDWLHNSFKAYGILLLILIIALSELCYLALASVSGPLPASDYAWLVSGLARFLPGQFATELATKMLWWLHFAAVFAFFYVIPNTKHLHLLFAPFNIYWSSLKPQGAIPPVDIDITEQDSNAKQSCGVKHIEDFTWKQLHDAFSCVLCGRCHGFCPSERSGERLKPKKINGRLRTKMEQDMKIPKDLRSPTEVAGGMFHYDFIWSCTTCGSCNAVCPVSVDHLSKIIDMRRNIISESKDIAPELIEVCSGIARSGNPWGKQRGEQLMWTKELGIPTLAQNPQAEYLLFIGCQGTFEPSARRAVIAFAGILQHAGINFAILGDEEWCCGETARRIGHELLFQKTARKNIAQWNALGIQKIITACPHCFNTIKNEYPQFGGNYQVIPHVVFLSELVKCHKLPITKLAPLREPISSEGYTKVTYHDPCYLGRYNQVLEQPRQLLAAIPGISLVEMAQTKGESFCCGAGGGRFWRRKSETNPISANRFRQASATGADMIITSCPYCHIIFQEQGECDRQAVKTMDIAELVYLSLKEHP